MKIHFIGIGGIGVSALARYWLARGAQVSGSDAAESDIVEELRKLGVKIFDSHRKKNLDSRFRSPRRSFRRSAGGNDSLLDLVIYSAAVREDNPELIEARRQGKKTQKYAEALGELTKKMCTIAISGMHGKSTTTAMIGLIMERAGLDPTVIVGTKVKWGKENLPQPLLKEGGSPLSLGRGREDFSNFRAGKSKYLVIEADEYDRSFLNYWPKILVLLNIEEEHLDTYAGGLPDIMETFKEYAGHLSADGVLVVNEEDENIMQIVKSLKLKVQSFNSKIKSKNFNLKIPGQHNLSNANAALAVARVLGIDAKIAIEALNNFF
ncbi:MAG: Mur ligase domain-containing protein, partial [Patescibacteria group bacterium]